MACVFLLILGCDNLAAATCHKFQTKLLSDNKTAALDKARLSILSDRKSRYCEAKKRKVTAGRSKC